jgi:hypothetical protein
VHGPTWPHAHAPARPGVRTARRHRLPLASGREKRAGAAGAYRRRTEVAGGAPASSGGLRASQGAVGSAFLILHGSSRGRVPPSNSRPGGGGAGLRWSWAARRYWLEPEKNRERWVRWKKQRGRGEGVGASVPVPVTHAVTTAVVVLLQQPGAREALRLSERGERGW